MENEPKTLNSEPEKPGKMDAVNELRRLRAIKLQEDIRLKRCLADRAELQRDYEAGQYIPVSVVKQALSAVFRDFSKPPKCRACMEGIEANIKKIMELE